MATPCIDDHQLSPEDFESKGELSSEAARIVLKCLYLARMNRVDFLWTVNALAREVTKYSHPRSFQALSGDALCMKLHSPKTNLGARYVQYIICTVMRC